MSCVAEHGAHEVFDPRPVPGYSQQLFEGMPTPINRMGSGLAGEFQWNQSSSRECTNHTYPPQNHPSFHQFAHTSTYPPPYYHSSPYFPPYYPPPSHPNCFTQILYPHSAPPPTTYPPYQELSMNSTAITLNQGACVSTIPTWHQQLQVQHIGVAEHAPLLVHSRPTETIQPCAIQGSPAVPNCHLLDYALDMECQQVPSVHATSNETDCLTKSEQQPHPGSDTQSICDMMAQIQTKLATISEKLRQDLKRMKSWETKRPAAAQPNHLTQEAINMSDEMPLYDVYDEEDNSCSTGICSVLDTSLVNQQDGESEADTYPLERAAHGPVFDAYDDETDGCSHEFVDMFATNLDQQPYEEEQQTSDQLLKCVSKATELKQTSSCLHTTSDVQVFSLELQQEDDERAYSCSDLKASNSVVTRSSQLSIEHSMRELRLLWDPGASAYLHSSKTEPPRELSYVAILFPKVLALCNQVGNYVEQQLTDQLWNLLVVHERRREWDPGDTQLHVLFKTAAGTTKLQCIDAYKSAMLRILVGQFGTSRAPIFQSAKQDVLINKHDISESKSDVSFLKSDISPRQHPCDLSNDKEEFSYKKLHFFPWIRRSAIIILQQLHNKNISSLLELSLEKRTQVQWDPGIELLLYELLWLETVKKGTEYALRHLLAMKFGTHDSTYFIDTATTMCSPANLIQQGRNFAAVLRFWLPIFNDMHCCQIFQKCNAISSQLCWYQDINFNGIPLWLINFQVP